ncbi:MAG: thiamine phosphate synthase [Deltaproteobacteria bacterium]|nr:thiamine phosphate synthase [Deltaproteobacteria bacterium]
MKRIDYSLYLVTDRGLSRGRPTIEIVKSAVRGGVTVVQLREKHITTKEYIREALEIKGFLNEKNIPLIINDRIDIAMAVEADGVHIGQNDMPLETAKNILKGSMLIGVSVESVEDAIEADIAGADYISVSPVFPTPTKTDTAPALGLEGIARISALIKKPVIGIGGINKMNCAEVIRSGANGISVVSAVCSAEDPELAARELKEIIIRARH